MDKYEVLKQIGKGSFGTVAKVRRKADGKVLVWKELVYKRMNDREKNQLVTEVNILRELKHPHIVRYYDRIIDKAQGRIFIVMEYCEGGDIGHLIKRCKQKRDYIGEDVIWKIFFQVVLALKECHRKPSGRILHRDIKPGNVFLDASYNVKLGDFGLARIFGENSVYAQTHVGTPYYMSPEQINEACYDEKSDIWSLGCLLYEIVTLHPPFEATTHMALATKIRAGHFDRVPSRYSEELQGLIKGMLSVQSPRRPSVDDLLQLPQLALRLQEKDLKDRAQELKHREDSVEKRRQELERRLKALEERGA
jgi:NIMA (never in mitosis gene a)-related kinase